MNNNYCDINDIINKKNLVITEILETEESYVNHLKEIVEEYLEYWKHKQILSKEHCNQLFGNITEIYEFSRIFLNELALANNNVTQIAHCFLKNHLKFIIYSTYCINFQNSDVIISKIMQSRLSTNIIYQRQKELGHRLSLGSYLVLPVQRILRYHLLLKKLAAYTSYNENDHSIVVKAYDKMVILAKIIDETKNKYEKEGRIKDIRLMMKHILKDKTNVDLYNNCFELHAEGDLMITGTKKKLHVIILNNMLLIVKEQKCGLLEYKTHIKSRNITVIEHVKENPLSFRLVSNAGSKHSFTLQATLAEEKIFWIKMLNKIKKDTSELSSISFAELMAKYFYIPRGYLTN
ncbi:pleckstrin homology domain-containing family G member 1-like isoform X6 [Aphis gossypii]|uniref:pleckstrin homology domain-containing family G member 1-like isoform X1 n=1 Tax=Aphis gossypii TaxID=80765 RepID=UPI00215989B9|nr:pleckstrin homology domain-containing family G member 1-like isoform X1 [Aphis gossypii]XP_050058831.1 pleckstrin homology domain-containing family G member 1-like isoform X3 [Aphis gossypii]XP_050058832.1 pleckstrin homology domain-containing family G member 1-like isoform X4 [Aphis gossypii]XP_050058834.1 pleckstrin homology domain-containing family G member 1-like isoform X6 [Aphis gossypii]